MAPGRISRPQAKAQGAGVTLSMGLAFVAGAAAMLMGVGVITARERTAAPPRLADILFQPEADPHPDHHPVRAVVLGGLSRFGRNRIPVVAAGVAFYALLALFPALSALISIYSLFADPRQAQAQLTEISFLLPSGGVAVVNDAISRLFQDGLPTRHMAATVGALISVWSANAGVKALFAGLNITYGAMDRRNILILNLVSLAFTLGGAVTVLASMGCIALAPVLLSYDALIPHPALFALRWPALLAMVAATLALLYRFGAARPGAHMRRVWPGVAFASVTWLGGSLLFSWYVSRFGHFDRTYGSLGAVIGFMTWIWLSVMVVLAGAELNAQIERVRGVRPLAAGLNSWRARFPFQPKA